MAMTKLPVQFTTPAIAIASGRTLCRNSSAATTIVNEPVTHARTHAHDVDTIKSSGHPAKL